MPSQHKARFENQEFWLSCVAHAESVAAKLREVDRHKEADTISACCASPIHRQCCSCKKHEVLLNHCDNFYCPKCTARLARKRQQSIEWWTDQVKQPKHIVLTCRNTAQITKATVQKFQEAIRKLRRMKRQRGWQNGFCCLEITNEGRGWHLHAHILVDAKWIDSQALAEDWAHQIGQDFAIVKVKSCRGDDYLHEVAKYVCKSNTLAAWSGMDIASFIDAFTGIRTFSTFGKFHKLRAQHREFLDQIHDAAILCECGCSVFRLFSEDEWQWELLKKEHAPPPSIRLRDPQPALFE